MYQICTKLNIETLHKMWSLLKVGNKGNRKISETIQSINRTVTQYEKAVQSQQQRQYKVNNCNNHQVYYKLLYKGKLKTNLK